MRDILTRTLAIVMSVSLMISLNAEFVPAWGFETEVRHDPPDYFVSGRRIKLEALVRDQAGINQVRCYFRAFGEADHVFVEMKPTRSDIYEGILPSPGKETRTIEYLFLTVNGKEQVVSTRKYELRRKDGKEAPACQQARSEGNIQVSTEVPEPPLGFTDSIVMDVAESSARYGSVTDLYVGNERAGDAVGTAPGLSRDSETTMTSIETGIGFSTSAETKRSTKTGTIRSKSAERRVTATSDETEFSAFKLAGIGLGTAALIGGLALLSDDDDGNSDRMRPYVSSPPHSVIPLRYERLSIGFSEAMETQSGRIYSEPGWVYKPPFIWNGERTLFIMLSHGTRTGQRLKFLLEDFKDTSGNRMDPYLFTVEVSDIRGGW